MRLQLLERSTGVISLIDKTYRTNLTLQSINTKLLGHPTEWLVIPGLPVAAAQCAGPAGLFQHQPVLTGPPAGVEVNLRPWRDTVEQ